MLDPSHTLSLSPGRADLILSQAISYLSLAKDEIGLCIHRGIKYT